VILAARALGLDSGPMSGFDNEVDPEFLSDGRFESNFLVNLGLHMWDQALRRRQIGMPVENRVFFAGEATSQFFPPPSTAPSSPASVPRTRSSSPTPRRT
jgi:hypothetical protein